MASLPPEVQAELTNGTQGAQKGAAAIVAYQIVPGLRRLADLADGQQLPTLARNAAVRGG